MFAVFYFISKNCLASGRLWDQEVRDLNAHLSCRCYAKLHSPLTLATMLTGAVTRRGTIADQADVKAVTSAPPNPIVHNAKWDLRSDRLNL